MKTYGFLPKLRQVLDFRHLDFNDEDDWVVVKWVWTRLLSAAAGKVHWNKDKYYRELISQLYQSGNAGSNKSIFNIPVTMEAFMAVAYDNNYEKNKAIWEDKENKVTPQGKRGRAAQGWIIIVI